VELVETLNPDNEASLASDEASLASEEARKGGGRRKRGIRGKRGRGAWEWKSLPPPQQPGERVGISSQREREGSDFFARGFFTVLSNEV